MHVIYVVILVVYYHMPHLFTSLLKKNKAKAYTAFILFFMEHIKKIVNSSFYALTITYLVILVVCHSPHISVIKQAY